MTKKYYVELECIDTEICIDAHNLKINMEELEKINHAWSEGHIVVVAFHRWVDSDSKIDIRTINNLKLKMPWDMDITREWKSIASILAKQQLPDEWLRLVEGNLP